MENKEHNDMITQENQIGKKLGEDLINAAGGGCFTSRIGNQPRLSKFL